MPNQWPTNVEMEMVAQNSTVIRAQKLSQTCEIRMTYISSCSCKKNKKGQYLPPSLCSASCPSPSRGSPVAPCMLLLRLSLAVIPSLVGVSAPRLLFVFTLCRYYVSPPLTRHSTRNYTIETQSHARMPSSQRLSA